jgi:peptidyl-dipeptidase Dcp
MNRLSFLPLIALLTIFPSCRNNGPSSTNNTDTLSTVNPLLTSSPLPYQAPAFDKIRDSDFLPAMEEGMRQQLEEIQKIADNPDTPTFDNTLVALERSGVLLSRVNGIFNLLTGANTNPALQKVQEEEAPRLAAHQDAIYLNSRLFKRVESIRAAVESAQAPAAAGSPNPLHSLDPESKRLVAFYYQKFELAGAKLSDADKDSLRKLNKEEASLSAKFTNQLLGATKAAALVVGDTAQLAGLPGEALKAAAQSAQTAGLTGKWIISLQNTTQQPDLLLLSDRATREKLFEASWNRAERNDSNDTRSTIARIAQIRAKKARLLGFDSYAAWALQDQMAKTPAAVDKFLGKLVPAATAKARKEAADIQAVIDAQKGGFALQPYDWNYYAEQVRKARYDLDESQVKPYFELDRVLKDGVFYAAGKLYGLAFRERKDIPVYQPDVRVFEVLDKDSSSLGLFYCDYYKRDNKSGGAWMDNMVGQSKLLGTKPIIYNVCNFTKPAPGQPALISFGDVTTMFHEFGHALHGFFASQQYPSLSGTSVPRDFVEFPSQFNEHWASDPEVFRNYAIHYQTGQPMPQALADKIKKAATFNQGYNLTEILAAADLDMQWHTLPAGDSPQDVDRFEAAALQKTHLDLPQVPSRYRSSYFLHIWSNGYAAGYYAYLWTEMLDDDAFSWFREHGGLTRENGQRFRDMILSRGNTEDFNKLFRDFRGHDPNIEPMLENRGLK